jgi:hypothetical protein
MLGSLDAYEWTPVVILVKKVPVGSISVNLSLDLDLNFSHYSFAEKCTKLRVFDGPSSMRGLHKSSTWAFIFVLSLSVV